MSEIANRFADASAESDGFSEILASSAQVGIVALGFLADRVQDVYRGFLVVQAAAAQVEASVRGFFNIGEQSDIDAAIARVDAAFAKLEESLADGRLSERLNEEVEAIKVGARARAEAIAKAVEERNASRTGGEIVVGETQQERAAKEKAAAAAKDAEERAAEAGRKALARLESDLQTEEERLAESYERRKEIVNQNLTGEEDATKRQDLLLQIEKDYQVKRRELYGLNQQDELAAEVERYEARRALAEELLDEEAADAERRAELLEQIEAEHQSRMRQIESQGLSERAKFEKKTTDEKVKHVAGKLVELTQGTAQSSKTMFRINKLAAIANATVNTAEGVTKTLAAYPYPLNVALAALSFAAGAAQINAIRSTSYEGGGQGTTPSAAGTVPVINDQPTGSSAQGAQGGELNRAVTQIVINGNFYGNEEAISDLMDKIEERISVGDQIFIDPNSRQAELIRSGG